MRFFKKLGQRYPDIRLTWGNGAELNPSMAHRSRWILSPRMAAALLGAAALLIGGALAVGAAMGRVDLPAPDFTCAVCLNHKPFKLSDLRGKVVLVDFWEYTCINCIRTFPYLRRWNRLYAPLGLVIVGVHTPEFAFAKNTDRVADATRRFGLIFPVAVDSDYKIWNAFHNQAWPADYLIDAKGNIVYAHIGEGEYGDMEHRIRDLLKQTNPALNFNQAKYRIRSDENVRLFDRVCSRTTPETYLGFARGLNIVNPDGENQTRETAYTAPADIPLDRFALEGRWEAAPEYIRHTRKTATPKDSVELHYRAKTVYLVAGSDDSTAKRLYVTQDGKPLPGDARGVDIHAAADDSTYIELAGKRMYYVVANPAFGRHLLRLTALDPAVSLYSFTFGNNCENKFAHH